MKDEFKFAIVMFLAAGVLFILTPAFPFDDIAALIVGLIFALKGISK